MAGKKGHRGWGWIRKLPSGRYQASYIGPDDLVRHKAPRTFSTRMDAEYWLGDERRLIELDAWTPPAMRAAQSKIKAVTVGEYAERWIEHRNIKPRTRSMYNDLLRLHIRPSLGKIPLKNLTPDAVRAWFHSLGTEHTRRNSHAYGLLNAICNTAVADDFIERNPCQLSRVMNPARKREPTILTVAEVAALADAIRPDRLRALVLLSAWCGVRWGEVSELRRKDVSDNFDVLTVARAVTRRDGEYRVDTPKSGKGRAVVIPPHIRDDIRKHLGRNVGSSPNSLLFPAASGGHMNDRVFSREYMAKALKAIGREGVRVHDLRHFAGTQTARVGNLVETMGRLGHSTVKASLTYQAVATGRDHEVAAALSKLAQE
ncbi:tyrosine-type recombinase/integrase [Mycolicibacterium fortuitum]|uniref:Site-specific integrase n=2 Tax=Mycolicibacterium fortuitum TaxID=1766 RepID=A0AAE5AF75_MYCFO|nr:site-specific integrase [Mycolicibacterium fortuitum]MCV7142754.1 tyrosine-type recombinase/integrase [Mycolicibacterium fortuitum]MDV7190589.1 site-specific integrase [Mycolicibacterium fortuitum]MDV7207932.1 site-specific integrase [Mycolicibacterium fortuitum]MDV7229853.1 site-specific integrase [Mycolicibacterium fortuitum]MDV7257780.1 site-specific integrase [Mycolicibacterium fortuitum]